MLLDDVMSELDASRRERLVDLVRGGGQALVSATEAEHVPGARASDDVELLFVADGAVALEAAA
jgi:DNA replication and repair protein RecF